MPAARMKLGLGRLAGLLLAGGIALHGGCGPVVAPGEEEDAGVEEVPPVDVCQRPDAPAFCVDTSAREPPSPCHGGKPDGRCTPDLEDCTCLDCGEVARCTEKCVDDGVCEEEGGEDCSCADCEGKVAGCAPAPKGCVDNGVCSPLEDDCTCLDCREDEHCQGCTANGYCVEFLEGCACADCAESPRCTP